MRVGNVVRNRVLRAALGVVALGAGALVAVGGQADAVGGTNLLTNPGFEGTAALTGWVGSSKTTLTLTSPGATGSSAANVAYKGTTTGAFSIATSTKTVKAVPAGEKFVADAQVRVATVIGKPICLQLLEQSSTATAQTVQKCVTPTDTGWHSFGPTTITTLAKGNSVKLQVRQASGKPGYAFQVDDLSFVDPDVAAPTAPTGVTTSAVTASSVTVKWNASTGGVVGYKIYRNNRTSVLATVVGATSFVDSTVVEGNIYSYKVVGYDFAGNLSAPSAYTPTASATTPWTSTPVAKSVWVMNDPIGATTMADTGGAGNTGALFGTVAPSGNATAGYHFSTAGGTSTTNATTGGYALVTDNASINPLANRIQFGIDVKLSALPVVPDYDLFRKGVAPGQEYKLEIQPNGQATCTFTGSLDHQTVQNGPSLNDSTWHSIQCSKDATTITLSVDGQSWTKTVTIGSITNINDLVIGAYPGFDFFDGDARGASLRIG